jgi:hypothetical protein
MAVRTRQFNQPGIYFCTLTCYKWTPLIELTNLYGFIYQWLERLVADRHQVLGFVIMPNHMHLMLFHPGEGRDLNTTLGEGKRFMAYEIIRLLKQSGRHDILRLLAGDVRDVDRRHGQRHRVFETSVDIKRCDTETFIVQKLNYIHGNPVKGRWNLAASYVEYPYSSVAFYEGMPCLVPMTHWKDAGI